MARHEEGTAGAAIGRGSGRQRHQAGLAEAAPPADCGGSRRKIGTLLPKRRSGPRAPGVRIPKKIYEIEVGDAPIRGSEAAKVTIVEWADFQCPFCVRVNPTLEQIGKEYGDKVRFAFKHLPLSMHAKARAAHAGLGGRASTG